MGLKCQINRNSQGEVESVGENNELFEDLKSYFKGDAEKAVDVWAASRVEGMEDSTLPEILTHLSDKRVENKSMSFKQRSGFLNNLDSTSIESLAELNTKAQSIFYPNGYFEVSKDRLENSGLYSTYEISNILSNSQVQNQIKSDLELLNKEVFSDNFEDVIPNSDTYSIAKEELPVVRKQVTKNTTSGFFSNTITSIKNLKDKNNKNVKGWINQLTDVQKNGGIRNVGQELAWIGLEDYLNEWVKENQPKNGNIPLSVIEQYVQDNQIEIVEVVKGDLQLTKKQDIKEVRLIKGSENNYEVEYKDGFIDKIYGVRDEEDAIYNSVAEINRSIEEGIEDTKYSEYQLEGGENYREILLTLPNLEKSKVIPFEEWTKEWFGDISDLTENQLYLAKKQYESKVGRKSGEIEKGYKSSHWDESNILAHIRLNERTLPSGERVLFIEEVQSDWAQDGKKKGFATNEQEEAQKEWDSLKIVADKLRAEGKEVPKEMLDRAKELVTIKNKPVDSSVPSMPYKKTDQWVGMVMRKVYQMAAQEGFDRVAWVTGEQSADRYDLSKQVENIDVQPKLNGDKFVFINMASAYNITLNVGQDGIVKEGQGNLDTDERYTGKNLSDIIGKELSQKVLGFKVISEKDFNYVSQLENDETGEIGVGYLQGSAIAIWSKTKESADKRLEELLKNAEANSSETLKGQDLKVGGEGMKTFYNSIVPKVAKKEAQRFDKSAKVEVIELKTSKQLSIPITPKMREILQKPVPLFNKSDQIITPTQQGLQEVVSRLEKTGLSQKVYMMSNSEISDRLIELGEGNVTQTTNGFVYKNEVYLNRDSATAETAIHEFHHLYNSYLKQNEPEMYNKGITLIKEEVDRGNKSVIKGVIDFVQKNQPSLQGEAKAEEVLTQLLGEKGVEFLNNKDRIDIIEWLKSVWYKIKRVLGLSQNTSTDSANMSLEQYVNDRTEGLFNLKDTDVVSNKVADTTEIVGLGMFKRLTDTEVFESMAERLSGITDRDAFDAIVRDLPYPSIIDRYFNDNEYSSEVFENYSNMTKISKYKQQGEVIVPDKKVDTAATIVETLLVGEDATQISDDINFLRQVPSDVWADNFNTVKDILSRIEVDAMKMNIDVIGLSDIFEIDTTMELLDALEILSDKSMLGLVKTKDIQDFAKVYDRIMETDTSSVFSYTHNAQGRTLLDVDNNLSELENFDQLSLLHTEQGLKHKVNRKYSTTQLSSIALDKHNSGEINLPQDIVEGVDTLSATNRPLIIRSIQGLMDRRIAEIDTSSVDVNKYREVLKEMLLYKTILNYPTEISNNINMQDEVNKLGHFTSDSTYLTTDFISDFYNYILDNKARQTDLYKDVLSHFKFDQRGIVLNDTDFEFVKNSIPDNKIFSDLKNYTAVTGRENLGKVFDYVELPLTKENKARFYQKFPSEVPFYQGNYEQDGEFIIAPNQRQDFIRIKQGVFESVAEGVYRPLGSKLEAPSIATSTQTPATYVTIVKRLSKSQLAEINNKIDECG